MKKRIFNLFNIISFVAAIFSGYMKPVTYDFAIESLQQYQGLKLYQAVILYGGKNRSNA